jgi:hypothetical protein
MPPSSSISKGSKLCGVTPDGCHSLVHIVLSGGRWPRTTARLSILAMLASRNLDGREGAEIARDSLNRHERHSFVLYDAKTAFL